MIAKTTTPEPLVSKPLWTDGEIIATGLQVFPKVEYDNSQGHRRRTFIADLQRKRDLYETDRRSHLSRIQELEDQVKALRDAQSKPIQGEVDRWISVANELPPIHEDDREDGFVLLLMLCASWKPDTWKTIKGSRVFGDYDEEGNALWFWADEDGDPIDDDGLLITYWQPIPPPPVSASPQ